ncbi:MAG: hypothetical protein AB8G99_24575, partial [Planctomycetaceae bacterium]
AASNNFQTAANELRLGRYQTAADGFRGLGNAMLANDIEFAKGELDGLADAFNVASDTILNLDDVGGESWVLDLTKAFGECLREAQDSAGKGQAAADYTRLGNAVVRLSEQIEVHQSSMREHLSRIAVPLPSFVVREYRFGENIMEVPRKIIFLAGNEDIVRFLTKRLQSMSDNGQLAAGGELSDELISRLTEDGFVTIENAERISSVLTELLADGTLKLDGGAISPAAEGESLFTVINQVVTDGRLSADDGWEISADLSNDLVHKGRLRVEVGCLSAGQYLGMARPDLFIRLPDQPFYSGYFKAVASIGMMMILIVTLGVCASCFVKGPVAIFLTVSLITIGQPFAYQFMSDLIDQQVEGGGLVEALIRMAKQLNPNVPLGVDEKVENLVNFIDETIVNGGLRMVKNIIPQFEPYTQGTKFVENGFDVPFRSCIQPGIMTLIGFVIPCVLIGYVALRFRELEAK